MTPTGEPRDDMALGRRSLLGALAAVGTADFATAASGREDEPGGSGVRVVEVGVEPKVGSFDLYRRGIIPVGVRLPASVDREDLQVRSLRFGPPRVVEAGEGARPERRERDVPVYHFPASEAGFEFGDATGRLAGRTEDGRRLLGETGLPSDGATGIFDPLL